MAPGGRATGYDAEPMELLRGHRVAVASYGVAAAYAGWLLRQYGADVRHVRALDPEGVGAFLAEGASFETTPPLEAAGCAVLVTDARVTAENRAAIDRVRATATVAWITPWGIDGTWAERPATDLTLHAAGGWMAAVGEAGGEPLGPPGAQGRLAAGLFAAMEVVHWLGLSARERPHLISVPVVEAVAATCIYDVVSFQYVGRVRERSGERYAPTQPTLMTL